MISILMATYNGEKYLQEQMDSLLSQTFNDFTLWINDDASVDGTWNILLDYASKHPDKIKLSCNKENSGGAKYNFLEMMSTIKDDYIMLCDQDDVWLPEKIEKTLLRMKELEQQYPNTPILMRTDMQVVDQYLQIISPSYRKLMCSNFDRTGFNQVLVQNTFAGCTAMYNRALAELLDKKPDYCIMHDWWLELAAAAFGKIAHVDEPTILYRQHSDNEVGIKDIRKLSYKIKLLTKGSYIEEAIQATYKQAESFLRVYGHLLTKTQKHVLKKYCAIPNMSRLKRWRTIYNLGAFKNGVSRNIAYFIFVVSWKN